MPEYAKCMKDLLTQKGRSNEASKITLNERCSKVVLNEIPLKEKDLGSFTIPCVIGQSGINKAFADLGASISLMPYSIPWVSPIYVVPKKGGITVVTNNDNELVPIRTVTGWRVCIDYIKLCDATRKDHFPLPFIDQMLERLSGNEYYCFLDGFSGYFQIPLAPEDQEKTTFTCPYGTFAYRRMPFGLWSKNLATDHLSRLENPELEKLDEDAIQDSFLDEHLMVINIKGVETDPWYADYTNFLVSKIVPQHLTCHLRKKFLSDVKKYIWDDPYLFKSCLDEIIRRCVFSKELHEILEHCHTGPTRGHYGADITARKVFEAGFYWPTIFKDFAMYVRECDACQRAGNISARNQMPLTNILVGEVFDIGGIDFMGPFPSSRNNKS
nr:DNA-directed DNA polymerase [Tanacetum cinerariifolium]